MFVNLTLFLSDPLFHKIFELCTNPSPDSRPSYVELLELIENDDGDDEDSTTMSITFTVTNTSTPNMTPLHNFPLSLEEDGESDVEYGEEDEDEGEEEWEEAEEEEGEGEEMESENVRPRSPGIMFAPLPEPLVPTLPRAEPRRRPSGGSHLRLLQQPTRHSLPRSFFEKELDLNGNHGGTGRGEVGERVFETRVLLFILKKREAFFYFKMFLEENMFVELCYFYHQILEYVATEEEERTGLEDVLPEN